jgi:alpha-L-fucosidase
VRSLGKPAGENVNDITSVNLLGYDRQVEWQQTPEGLVVTLPAQKISEYTAALKITGTNLKNIPFTVAAAPLTPDAKGNLTLGADDADLHGSQIKTENQGGKPNIGFWDKGDEWVSWKVQFTQPGKFKVSASCACTSGGAEFVVEVAGQQLTGQPEETEGWDKFKEVNLGEVEVDQPGDQVVNIRPKNASAWKAMNLRFVKLSPTPN